MTRPTAALGTLLSAAVAVGCTTQAAPSPKPSGGTQEQVTTRAELPILRDMQGRRFPVPLVTVSVDGHPTKFVVDTGATHTVLTTAFATEHHIALKGDEVGTGHGGASDAVNAKHVPSIAVRLGAFEKTLEDGLAVDGPPPFAALGIGGFLSPQTFVERGAIILDFPNSRLLVVDGDWASVKAWAAKQYSGAQASEIARSPEARPRNLLVPIAVGSRSPTPTLLDTGGSKTWFDATYLGASKGGDAGSAGVSVSGAKIETSSFEPQILAAGSLRIGPVPMAARPAEAEQNGVVGMDVLDTLVLVVPPANVRSVLVIATKR